jgi:HSP90 family molecular chaperone
MLSISRRYDKEARTLSLIDKGIGMTRGDLIKNLGIVAKSGTSEFVEAVAGGQDSLRFAIDFYYYY